MVEQVQGFKELAGKLSKLGKVAGGKALRSAAMRATTPVLRDAKSRAPVGKLVYSYSYGDREPYPKKTHKGRLVGPGFLARNIGRKSIISSDKTRVTVLIGPRPEAYYGTAFLELGTSRQPPQPFLEPAFRAGKSDMINGLREIAKQNIEKVARGR